MADRPSTDPSDAAEPPDEDSVAEASECAEYLRALGDPTRLRIVQMLRGGPLTVSDIAGLLELEIATVSHHLRVLYHARITVTRREGKYVYYSVNPRIAERDAEIRDRGRRIRGLDFGCCKLDIRGGSPQDQPPI